MAPDQGRVGIHSVTNQTQRRNLSAIGPPPEQANHIVGLATQATLDFGNLNWGKRACVSCVVYQLDVALTITLVANFPACHVQVTETVAAVALLS